MPQGFDTNHSCLHVVDQLKSLNIDFVGRYYANSGPKVLTRAEALALSTAGIAIVAVWEDGFPTKAGYFSYSKGVDDGTSACHDAQVIGQPVDSPIYFAVDCDAAPDEVAGAISDYFRGIAVGFAASSGGQAYYPVGVYGSGLTCSSLLARNMASVAWLSQSMGFRESRTYQGWVIKQGLPEQTVGLDSDPDQAADGYGGFLVT
jgi:hypothetical protein